MPCSRSSRLLALSGPRAPAARLAAAALLVALASCSDSPTAPSVERRLDGVWVGSITGLTFGGASGAAAPIRLEIRESDDDIPSHAVSGTLSIDSDAGPVRGSFSGVLEHELAIDLETGEAWRCGCQARLDAQAPGYLRLHWFEWLCVDAGGGVIEVRRQG